MTRMKKVKKVGILTAGGLAPCLSSAIGYLIHRYTAVAPEVVVASNPGCAMHMARGAAERGLAVRIEHLVELLARAYPPPVARR